jgi:UDP-N-acetylmuramate--alanine ligase
MHVFIAGIGGAGLGPLAQLCLDCGFTVSGSELHPSLNTQELDKRGVEILYGQTGEELETFLQTHEINWYIHSSAINPLNLELQYIQAYAQNHPDYAIQISKRSPLLNFIIREKNLNLVAICGTHGKTTTTAMVVWAFHELGIPVSYSYLAIVPGLDYDHPDIYPTQSDYDAAFEEFLNRCTLKAIGYTEDLADLRIQQAALVSRADPDIEALHLPGIFNRQNAFLVEQALQLILPDISVSKVREILSRFPGTQRRQERLSEHLYSDYAHHPSEIKATLQVMHELADLEQQQTGKRPKIVTVYQPHQNGRQHEIYAQYKQAFTQSDQIYWLPTYFSRERPDVEILTPDFLISQLSEREQTQAQSAVMGPELRTKLLECLDQGNIVVLMCAGDLDEWGRRELRKVKE